MDCRQEVTDAIVTALEGGVPPWRKGWIANVAPFNASSGKSYRGVNQLITLMQGRQDPRWVTFKQAQAMGLSVRKGEKGDENHQACGGGSRCRRRFLRRRRGRCCV